MKRFLFLVFFLLIICFSSISQDKLTIKEPTFRDGTSDEKALLNSIVHQAVLTANTWYREHIYIEFPYKAQGADFIVNLNTNRLDAEYCIVVELVRIKDERESDWYYVRGKLDYETALYLANAIFHEWATFNNFLYYKEEEPPVFIDELYTPNISDLVITPFTIYTPTGMTIKPNGNLIMCFTSYALEFDANFGIVSRPGFSLLEEGNYNWAYGANVTPSGTLYLKPSMGREIYKILDFSDEVEVVRMGINISGFGVSAALPDGSLVFIDSVQRTGDKVKDGKKEPFNVFPSQYSTVSAVTLGPEGNLWVFDQNQGRVRIYSEDGAIIESIIPLIDSSTSLSSSFISVYPDGSFLLGTFSQLLCFDRNGVLLWSLSQISDYHREVLPQFYNAVADPDTGFIYMVDLYGQRVLKFMDVYYCEKNGIENEFANTILSLNEEFYLDDSKSDAVIEKARLYEEAGSLLMALNSWVKVLEIDYYNIEAEEKIEEIQFMALKRRALELKYKTLEILENIGPESARQKYAEAMKLFEQIISMHPQDTEMKEEKEDLELKFSEKSIDPGDSGKPITIVNVDLGNIFPSLMQTYLNVPVGTVTIKNTQNESITDVKASIYVVKYMDFPSETEWPETLGPGKEVEIDLKMILNSEIFNLQEDMPLQAKVEVSYFIGYKQYSVSTSVGLTMYRRSALSWDDSGKLAAFIMPNEGIVSTFSLHMSEIMGDWEELYLSDRLLRAIRIIEALGLYNIVYVEDTEAPISEVLGREEVVDTVRFPRTTLQVRSGDCDDSTALLASLLESVGIKTAIMTSPGHVFLAFDTGEPEQNMWLYSMLSFEVIEYNSTLWMPIETTVLQKGFMHAWLKASELVRTYKDQIEFLPVHVMWEKYPPLPIPESSFVVVEPDPTILELQFNHTTGEVKDNLYTNGLSILNNKYNSLTGLLALKVKNQIGILHAQFGEMEKAEEIFKEIINSNPSFVSAYLNLANLYYNREDINEAIDVLEDGLTKNPGSVYLNLLMARCYYKKGDSKKVAEYFTKVEEYSPELADKFAFLIYGEGFESEDNRAGLFDEPLIWDPGE
jgi:tetratricopeptide (TPR) repeat protein